MAEPISAAQHDQRIKLYEQGLNDREIGERMSLHQATIWSWRQRHGLPRHVKQDLRPELYRQGLSDSEIAAALGVEAKGVAVWRNTNYLRANKDGDKEIQPLKASCPMSEALTPSQCRVMTRFFVDLLRLADAHPGTKISVGTFIKEWRKGGR